jgi:hypothetical protein
MALASCRPAVSGSLGPLHTGPNTGPGGCHEGLSSRRYQRLPSTGVVASAPIPALAPTAPTMSAASRWVSPGEGASRADSVATFVTLPLSRRGTDGRSHLWLDAACHAGYRPLCWRALPGSSPSRRSRTGWSSGGVVHRALGVGVLDLAAASCKCGVPFGWCDLLELVE